MKSPSNGHNLRVVVNETRTESDVRGMLEREHGTACRQALLKILWKLTRQPSKGELSVSTENATVCSEPDRTSSRSTLRRNTDLSTSC